MKKIVITLNIAVLLIIFSFYGCGTANETNSGSTTTQSPGATTHIVKMRDYEFVPSSLTINKGDSVKWVLVEGYHSTTSGKVIEGPDGRESIPDGIWDSTLLRSKGESFTYTFNSAGMFPYYCITHYEVGMTGTITVK